MEGITGNLFYRATVQAFVRYRCIIRPNLRLDADGLKNVPAGQASRWAERNGMKKVRMITPRAEGLDRLSQTFMRDKQFCEILATTHSWSVGRMFVYLRWAQNYIPCIQEELQAMVVRHFPTTHTQDASFWTLSLTGGIFKDLGLIPYLVIRGLIWDAGFALRRSLESVPEY
jgi:hypothetical protein